jgi:hypothetical protein
MQIRARVSRHSKCLPYIPARSITESNQRAETKIVVVWDGTSCSSVTAHNSEGPAAFKLRAEVSILKTEGATPA